LAIPVAPLRAIAWLVAAFAPGDSRLKDLPQAILFITSQRRYRMDKACELLGWQPRVNLQEGILSCEPYLREKRLLS
jgi:nucleoside-diphosphate-sugar epimerase